MTTVRCTCPTCGDVQTTISNITLLLFEGRKDVDGEYRFRCPECNTIVLKPAPINIINLLYQSGAPTEVVEPSIELLERPRPEDAAPIDMDDILELGLALEQDEEGWWSRLLGENE
jgi:hypothetical protein